MKCQNCERAKTNAIWPGYQATCRGCKVRALANSLPFFESSRDQAFTPAYKSALISSLGEDWKASHKEVKEEFTRLKAMKGDLT